MQLGEPLCGAAQLGEPLRGAARRCAAWRTLLTTENNYTILSCLGQSANLLLPELGYNILMKPGDVVGFLAQRYKHKLVPEKGEGGEGRQIIFTCWSDQNAQDCIKRDGDFDDI